MILYLISPGSFLASLDHLFASFDVPVHPLSQRFFRFFALGSISNSVCFLLVLLQPQGYSLRPCSSSDTLTFFGCFVIPLFV